MRKTRRMPQLVVRLDSKLFAAIDRMVAEGVAGNRSEVVRLAIERLVDEHRRKDGTAG